MNKVRMAVIGGGHLGRIHTRLLANQENVCVVAVADPSAEARLAAARDFGVPVCCDHRELLGQFDAAIVATPTESHHAVAGELLDHGYHVLVEKPIATTVAEADDLVRRAAQQGCVLQVGHVERFNPAVAAVRPRCTEVRYLEAVRTSGYSGRSIDIGVVADLMIHDIDLALSLVGAPVVAVHAIGSPILGPHEDVAQARLHFANGSVANLSASRTSDRPQRTLRVYDAELIAELDLAAATAEIIEPSETLRRRRLDVRLLDAPQREELRLHLFRDHLRRRAIEVPPANAIEQEQRDFLAAVRHGKPVQVPGEAGRDALEVAENIRRQIAAAPAFRPFHPLPPARTKTNRSAA